MRIKFKVPKEQIERAKEITGKLEKLTGHELIVREISTKEGWKLLFSSAFLTRGGFVADLDSIRNDLSTILHEIAHIENEKRFGRLSRSKRWWLKGRIPLNMGELKETLLEYLREIPEQFAAEIRAFQYSKEHYIQGFTPKFKWIKPKLKNRIDVVITGYAYMYLLKKVGVLEQANQLSQALKEQEVIPPTIIPQLERIVKEGVNKTFEFMESGNKKGLKSYFELVRDFEKG